MMRKNLADKNRRTVVARYQGGSTNEQQFNQNSSQVAPYKQEPITSDYNGNTFVRTSSLLKSHGYAPQARAIKEFAWKGVRDPSTGRILHHRDKFFVDRDNQR